MDIIINFEGKKHIHDILDILYKTLNDLLGREYIVRGRRDKEVWDAYYDDVFGVLTEDEFIKKYGPNIHFVLKNLDEFKKAEPENYKMFLESTIGYQVEEIATNKYVKDKLKFSYEIK